MNDGKLYGCPLERSIRRSGLGGSGGGVCGVVGKRDRLAWGEIKFEIVVRRNGVLPEGDPSENEYMGKILQSCFLWKTC